MSDQNVNQAGTVNEQAEIDAKYRIDLSTGIASVKRVKTTWHSGYEKSGKPILGAQFTHEMFFTFPAVKNPTPAMKAYAEMTKVGTLTAAVIKAQPLIRVMGAAAETQKRFEYDYEALMNPVRKAKIPQSALQLSQKAVVKANMDELRTMEAAIKAAIAAGK